jgi:hypothetical protein
VKAQGSVGNEFRELIRKLEKLDRAPEREARGRAQAERKRRRKPEPATPVRPS